MVPRSTPNHKLEAERLKRRWSVEVATKKIGVSVNTFNRWERGLQLPQLETLDLLCKAFDMSPEELGFEHIIANKRRVRKSDPAHEIPEAHLSHEQPSLVAPKSIGFVQPYIQDFTIRQVPGGTNERLSGIQELGQGTTTRRQAMALLVNTSSTVFDMAQGGAKSPLYPDEILLLSAVNIPLCWQLYYEGGFVELRSILPSYIQQLTVLALPPSRYQKQAAYLASQVHQLSYLLALQNQDFGTSLNHTQEALHYAHIAEDTNLQIASLARKAYIYFCLHRNGQKLQAYEEAFRLCNTCSPLLRGYIYAGLAETYASYQDEARAHEFLQLAHKHYPDRPEEDPTYIYTHFRWPTFYNLAGQIHLHLKQPEEAWKSFMTVDRLVPECEEPYRVELMVYQAATAVELGDMEQGCDLLIAAVQSARNLGSELRYNEAYKVYIHMQTRWRNEARVQALEELFS
ncbi:MAG: helix-turn-helix transcriptional regulator [Ktedonobacteraceae bacterium]|nr:helix-turn-helix transcriptional regulator [Ktedonobacteraceae bacterium]